MKYFALILLLAGCEPLAWERANAEYQCHEDQMAKVQKEKTFAMQNDKANSSFRYIYGNAILRNCTRKEK